MNKARHKDAVSQKSVDPDLIIRDMAELRLGAPVVHLQFGVGRYQGFTTY